ncbi:MAG TPA: M20/M25/M40 family metallo-hydrolase [Bacteroidota bacterium]|nr:M20/M25/M40 family metallo-hydrolase [Bacteroidota bacterium]
MKTFSCAWVLVLAAPIALSQVSTTPYDSLGVEMFRTSLASGKAYEALRVLTSTIGNRISGSPKAAQAVQWAKKYLEDSGAENVHLEPVMVPRWVRGPVEEAALSYDGLAQPKRLRILAIGGSIATPKEGITAEVVEVHSFEELKLLGGKARGKIVFFNRPMDRTRFATFEAYGGAVDQRVHGAVEAARVGGVAALVRSMTTLLDNSPHTGAMNYADSVQKIPAACVSTNDAEAISAALKSEQSVKVHLTLSCETLPDVESANVVGEIPGSEMKEDVIVMGGHLDSWDVGQGAHDDGAGVVQSVEALRLLKQMGLRPKRTIRVVLFMNEENGLRGGLGYAEKVRPGEHPIAAIETDAGGLSPRGFGVGDSAAYVKILRWAPVFRPIGGDRITLGGGGADIGPLGRKGAVTIGLSVDSHRYFDYHHSENDTFDKVNERELELGAAMMAMLAYMISQEGL